MHFVDAVEVAGGALISDLADAVVGVEQHAERGSQQFEPLQTGAVDDAAVAGNDLDLRVALGGGADGGWCRVTTGEDGEG